MTALRLFPALLLTGLPALAHDFWLEPSTYAPTPGQPVVLRLRVGENFVGDPVARDPALLERFVAFGARGEVQVPGMEGRDPAGALRIFPEDGLILVGYQSRPSLTTMDAETFEDYVAHEGLERRLFPQQVGAEGLDDAFSRHVKAFLQRSGQDGRGFDRILGFELELVPEVNPSTLKLESEKPARLSARLLFRGAPKAGVLVQAFPRRQPSALVKATTDAGGRVELTLDRADIWLIKAVVAEMVDGPVGALDADLRSYWATLTFEIPKE